MEKRNLEGDLEKERKIEKKDDSARKIYYSDPRGIIYTDRKECIIAKEEYHKG